MLTTLLSKVVARICDHESIMQVLYSMEALRDMSGPFLCYPQNDYCNVKFYWTNEISSNGILGSTDGVRKCTMHAQIGVYFFSNVRFCYD